MCIHVKYYTNELFLQQLILFGLRFLPIRFQRECVCVCVCVYGIAHIWVYTWCACNCRYTFCVGRRILRCADCVYSNLCLAPAHSFHPQSCNCLYLLIAVSITFWHLGCLNWMVFQLCSLPVFSYFSFPFFFLPASYLLSSISFARTWPPRIRIRCRGTKYTHTQLHTSKQTHTHSNPGRTIKSTAIKARVSV